jgi:hypothetical protein
MSCLEIEPSTPAEAYDPYTYGVRRSGRAIAAQ